MVRDLGEFGKPNAVIDTSKLHYVHKRDITDEYGDPKSLVIIAACGGASIEFSFEQSDKEKWEKCFEFFKKCAYENGT